jgi:mannosyltransferase
LEDSDKKTGTILLFNIGQVEGKNWVGFTTQGVIMSNVATKNTSEIVKGNKLKAILSPTIILIVILIFGIALRFYDLGAENYWNDEMYTVIEGQQTFPQLLNAGRLDQPLAYYIPFLLWERIFGTSEVATRSFSALAGIGSILLIYLVGRELFNKPIGLLGSFFMAISEFQITYSQTARFYCFFELMTLLSFLFFILSLKNKRYVYYLLYVISSIIMVYSLSFGVFILAAQNLFMLIKIRKYKKIIKTWIIGQGIIIIALIPYFIPLIFGEKGMEGAVVLNIGKIPAPSIFQPLSSMYRFIFPYNRFTGWTVIFLSFIAAGLLLVIGAVITFIRKGNGKIVSEVKNIKSGLYETPDFKENILLLCIWLLCPVVLPYLFSIIVTPIYKVYYTISAAPALYLLIALGIFSIRKVLPISFSIALYLVMILPSLGQYYLTDVNPQWKETALFVEKNSKPGDLVVIVPNGDWGDQSVIQQRIFENYYQGSIAECSLGGKLTNSEAISEAVTKCITNQNRIWVIVPEDLSESAARYTAYFENTDPKGLHLEKEQRFVQLSLFLFDVTN